MADRHERAGQRAQDQDLVDLDALLGAYRERTPDLDDPGQRVSFGTSGHRGSSLDGAFNDAHIAAMSQAVAEYRAEQGIVGPLYLGKDTHALSDPAHATAIEVLVANDVDVHVAADDGFTPTPSISHAILTHNKPARDGAQDHPLADGVVITPSHNPPRDGGYKYNPPSGGPAGTDATGWIQDRANALLADDNRDVARISIDDALASSHLVRFDLMGTYVADLGSVVDLDAIRDAGIRLGIDPMGGAAVAYWQAIADTHGLDLTVVTDAVDPRFAFMTLDTDGKIRMDCSSPDAMASMIAVADDYQIGGGNDADADRHGVVTPGAGLMNPNHYLAVMIQYLLGNRPEWDPEAGIGKTLVSSSMIDRVVADLDRRLTEVPVGFKWFVDGLVDASIAFGGEESAGASFLRRDGTVWTTDKDGIVPILLAAELTAVTGTDPGEHYAELTERFGSPVYRRISAPATREQKATLKDLSPEQVDGDTLAGDPIKAKMTKAPGNDAAIGGLKVTTEHGWFAARPSGTEDIYKVYAESFKGEDHLDSLLTEAQDLVDSVLGD